LRNVASIWRLHAPARSVGQAAEMPRPAPEVPRAEKARFRVQMRVAPPRLSHQQLPAYAQSARVLQNGE